MERGGGRGEEEGGEGREQSRVDDISYLATASSTCGSCSHLLRASTLLVFRCGRLSIKIASAQRIPDAGHSCMAENKRNAVFDNFLSLHVFVLPETSLSNKGSVHSGQSQKFHVTSGFLCLMNQRSVQHILVVEDNVLKKIQLQIRI